MSDVVSDRMLYDHLEQLAARQDEAAYLRCQVRLLTDEVERLRLTKTERKAVEACAVLADKTDLMVSGFGGQWKPRAATLRGLLERTK
jgi:hypothetical protein